MNGSGTLLEPAVRRPAAAGGATGPVSVAGGAPFVAGGSPAVGAGKGPASGPDGVIHWKLVTPFLLHPEQPWIHQAVRSPHHTFSVVTADYAHDRSREVTSASDWLDYFRHAVRAWFAGTGAGRRRVGYITAFPQLPVCVGLLKRLTRSRAPVVAWFFNLGRTYDGPKRRLARYCLARIDIFIVHSRREIANYAAMLNLPRERFVFVPFTEEHVEPEFTEDAANPFVVSIGTANRDYRTLLAALAALGLPAVIVAGPHALAGLDIPPNVTVRSGLSLAECRALCQRARVNVVPLDTDETASGQVTVRDAMMFGKAVVATASIGNEDYIENGVTGMLVQPRDAVALAAAIGALWDDQARRAAIGAAARDWVLQHASFDVGHERLLAVLERVRLNGAA